MSAGDVAGDRPAQVVTLFIVVVLIALLPRVIGIDFGLPVILQPDELEPAGRADHLISGQYFSDYEAWRYPPLLAELLALQRKISPCPSCDEAAFILRGRWINVIVSALAAGVLALAGRRIGLPIWAAALAGLLFAVCPLAVRLARYSTPDALMSALVAVGVWTCARLPSSGRWRDYAACGLIVGLAAAAKYNAALIFVMVVAVHVVVRWRDRSAWLRLCVAGLISVAVFGLLLIWPWTGLDPFLAGLGYEWRHYERGHDGFDCANAALEALRYLFRFALGPLAGLVLVLGSIARIQQARVQPRTQPGIQQAQVAVAASVFVLVYLALLARQQLFFARLVAPLVPVLALLVALAAAALADELERRFGRARRSLIITSLLGSVLLLPGVATIEQVRAIRDTDTRLLAHRWIDEHMHEPGLKIALMPRSAATMLPRDMHGITVYAGMTLARLRQIGVTHVLYNAGSVGRFRWRPEDNVEALERWDGFHDQLEAGARLVMRWEHAPFPDAAHFGDASRVYHHSSVEIWALD